MRLHATKLSATGGNYSSSPYLPESVEFFSRASVTDANAKQDIDVFVRQTKTWGIWDKLVYVPCLSTHGGLHQLGGAAQRTNTPWTLVNATQVAQGVQMQLNGYSNYLLSDQVVNNSAQPLTFGNFHCQIDNPKSHSVNYFTASRVGTNNRWLGHEFWSAPARTVLRAVVGSYILANSITGKSFSCNNYKQPKLYAASMVFGSTAYEGLCDDNIGTGNLGYNLSFAGQKMRFYAANTEGFTGNGWVSGAFFYYGTLADVGHDAWVKFRALVAQTILCRLGDGAGHRRLLLAGQSNSSNSLASEISRQSTDDFGMFSVFNSGFGGQPISTWIGAVGSNSRQAAYSNAGQGFWGTSGSLPAFQSTRLAGGGRYKEYLVWFQGEADHNAADTAANYRQQLATLINYFREDTGNPDLKVIVIQIDAGIAMRNSPSALTLTAFSGGLTALNGTYNLTTLTTETQAYVWTKAGFRVEEQSNRWVFVETVGNTVVASAVQANLPHPALVTGWVDASNNAITPSFGAGNRLEWIERVRYAQREICNDLPNVYTFDSRGYTRTDSVHIDAAALIPFAAALNAYLLTI